jgi:hypothetical protein
VIVLVWALMVERLSPGPVGLLGDGADDVHPADPAPDDALFRGGATWAAQVSAGWE